MLFMDLVGIPAAVLILSTLSIWIFPCYWAVTGRLHHRASHSVKNYRISHLVNICWPGGLFVCYAFDCLGKTSFRVFVKCRMTRIYRQKRVSDKIKATAFWRWLFYIFSIIFATSRSCFFEDTPSLL